MELSFDKSRLRSKVKFWLGVLSCSSPWQPNFVIFFHLLGILFYFFLLHFPPISPTLKGEWKKAGSSVQSFSSAHLRMWTLWTWIGSSKSQHSLERPNWFFSVLTSVACLVALNLVCPPFLTMQFILTSCIISFSLSVSL